jgi:type IV secretory pathway VirB2 component (pilin)
MAEAGAPENRDFANRQASFVNETTLSFTLRRWREIVSGPRARSLAAIVAVTATVIAPFGTDRMGFGLRLLYWTGVVVSHTLIAIAVLLAVSYGLRRWIEPRWLRLLIAGIVAALPLGLIQIAISHLVQAMPLTPVAVGTTFLSTLTITLAVTAAVGMFQEDPNQQPAPALPPAPRPGQAFLARLPIETGRDLVSLTMQDHYIEVRTRTGQTLLLMRLSDAVKELEGVDGMQIHRSHWVARGAVAKLHRDDGRLLVEMADGRKLPVSRSYAAAVRAAGFPE